MQRGTTRQVHTNFRHPRYITQRAPCPIAADQAAWAPDSPLVVRSIAAARARTEMRLPAPTSNLHALSAAATQGVQGALCSLLVLSSTLLAPHAAIAATDGAAIGQCLLRNCQCVRRIAHLLCVTWTPAQRLTTVACAPLHTARPACCERFTQRHLQHTELTRRRRSCDCAGCRSRVA